MNPSKTNPTDVIRETVRVELACRRMTQTELAERLGMSRQHLSKAMLGGQVRSLDVRRVSNYLGRLTETEYAPIEAGMKKMTARA